MLGISDAGINSTSPGVPGQISVLLGNFVIFFSVSIFPCANILPADANTIQAHRIPRRDFLIVRRNNKVY